MSFKWTPFVTSVIELIPDAYTPEYDDDPISTNLAYDYAKLSMPELRLIAEIVKRAFLDLDSAFSDEKFSAIAWFEAKPVKENKRERGFSFYTCADILQMNFKQRLFIKEKVNRAKNFSRMPSYAN